MAAEAKAMMDALMGQHRNAALSSDLNVNKKREETCYDPDVCPYYAVWGVDLWDLFVNTKSDIGGVNPKKVSDKSHDFYKVRQGAVLLERCGVRFSRGCNYSR